MKVPIHRLRKDKIIWLNNHNCKAHRKTFLEHYNCYLKEQPDTERVAIWDIETTNLDADYGVILTWCVKPLGSDKILRGVVTPADLRSTKGDEDRRVVHELIDTIQQFDKLIGYYSKRYDAPYVRARAVHMGIPFPYYGSIRHVDVYDIIRHRFKISRKRQETACRFLLGHTDKTHFDGSVWRAAARGDRKALKQVLDHNIYDVQDLEKLYLKVVDFSRKQDTSI